MVQQLNEEQIITGFHSILKDSLAQARGEGLLSDEEIEAADVDVQLAGPALCLFFAALGAQNDPPEISSPDGSFTLTNRNCPPSFASYFKLWQQCVPAILRCPPHARHDIALLLCDKDPLSSPILASSVKLAGDLKSIGLEITQRRTFQLRYAEDLNHALQSSVRPRRSEESGRDSWQKTHYSAPPQYDDGDIQKLLSGELLHSPPDLNSPASRIPSPLVASGSEQHAQEHDANLAVIRETLYSALADCIVTTPGILIMFTRGPEWASRAFFASTCLAILEVCLTRVDSHGVRAVNLGRNTPKAIGASETPPHLRPFLGNLIEVSQAAKAIAEADDERAMQEAMEGKEELSVPGLDRLRQRLENGVEFDLGQGGGSVEENNALTQLANAINGVAIGMSNLAAFRERQADAFKILSAVKTF